MERTATTLAVRTARPAAGVAVVSAAGEIDLGTLTTWDTALAAALHSPPEVLVADLSAVEFLGSSGIATLVMVQQETAERGVEFRVAGATRAVRRALEATGVGEVLRLYETVELAVHGGALTQTSTGSDSTP
ncbi:STAS domain-containing protein [Amycolatopsis sp. 195334CR]|uniref:STAS domain-containing protein n=1 Tax=Amycolatopsis sp. 195334CR TaxID=2814588 RepID=UPI001A906E2E|nr:STAS domain-containing protein [Amycolatopsis sp. 195334CR]MBN6040619.1 STAS domain-containing protein [Amycolatopsis sp. 195334CR]